MSSLPRSAHAPRPNQPRSLPSAPPNPTASPTSAPPPSIPDRSRSRAAPRLEPVVEGDTRLLRDVRKPPPGDVVSSVRRRGSSPALARQRSLYFEQAFGSRRETSDGQGARDRAVVLAEVKTNVFIANEMAFMTDLSEHLSHRYARPISSIAVTLQHGVCLLMGGSLEPAYIVAIHALPGLVQTATNKRNAALLQRHLLGALGVVPARGMIRFVGVPEECLAVGGRTVAGELAGERTGVEGRRVQRRRTVRTFSRLKDGPSGAQQPTANISTPVVPAGSRPVSSLSYDTGLGSAGHQLRQTPTGRSQGGQGVGREEAGSPKPKGLRHNKSFAFIQSLFGGTSKADAEST